MAGALQENIELCAWRSRGAAPATIAKIDAIDAESVKARRKPKAKAPSPA